MQEPQEASPIEPPPAQPAALQTEPPAPTPKLPLTKRLRFIVKNLPVVIQAARKTGAAGEQAESALDANFKRVGVSDENRAIFRELLAAGRQILRADKDTHRVDRYAVGAAGVLDLVLLQILAPLGIPDRASGIAWLAFCVSLPCILGFIFVSFVNQNNRIVRYWKLHRYLASFALLATFISLTALIWHVWFVAGILFLCLGAVIGIICIGYWVFLGFSKYFYEKRQAAAPPIGLDLIEHNDD